MNTTTNVRAGMQVSNSTGRNTDYRIGASGGSNEA
jgi:hypothetical protein